MEPVQDQTLLEFVAEMPSESNDEYMKDIWTNVMCEIDEILDMEVNKNDIGATNSNLNDQVNELYNGNLQEYYFDLDSLLVNLNSEAQTTSKLTTNFTSNSYLESSQKINICNEIDIHSATLDRTTKTISICICWKEVMYGQERLEAEKALLLADFKRNALLEKSQKIDCDVLVNVRSAKTASIIISDVQIPFPVQQSDSNKSWYLVVCSCGTAVQASSLLQFPSESGFLTFPETFALDGVPQGSAIKLQLFELKMRDLDRESKSILGLLRFNNKPSAVPRKERTIRYKDSFGHAVESTVLSSIFHLRSSLTITVQTNGTPTTISECCECTVQGSFIVSLEETKELFAFVAVGKEIPTYLLQGNYWCPFEGNVLQFWRNSSELVVCVDLENCFIKHAQRVDKFIVNLPRMVLVEINFSTVKKRYYLVTSTMSELELWANKLNTLRASFDVRKLKATNIV